MGIGRVYHAPRPCLALASAVASADSGSFYRAGTTEEVTGIAQGGVDCPDATLGPALQAALDARPDPAQGDA